MPHVKADLEVGRPHPAQDFQEEFRLGFVDIFQHHRHAVRGRQGGQLLPGGGAAGQPALLIPAVVPGFIAQVADHRHRPKHRQIAERLAQAAAGRGQDAIVQRPRGQVLKGAVQGDPPSGPLKSPGRPAKVPGAVMSQAIGVQANFRIEAPVQKLLEVPGLQERERGD